MSRIYYFERLTLGFRMLEDDYGTEDEDEIPQDLEDVSDITSEDGRTISDKM